MTDDGRRLRRVEYDGRAWDVIGGYFNHVYLRACDGTDDETVVDEQECEDRLTDQEDERRRGR